MTTVPSDELFLSRATEPIAKRQDCVLTIEDNEDAMRLVQFALREHGDGKYRLEWAKDLQSGIDQISKGGIDIVLLDLGLPDSAGASSYSWIHRMAPDVPVLVLTGDKREGTEFAVLARGADDYLVKNDVSGAQLVQAIQAALDLSKHRCRNQMQKLALRTETLLSEGIQAAVKEADLTVEPEETRFLPDGF